MKKPHRRSTDVLKKGFCGNAHVIVCVEAMKKPHQHGLGPCATCHLPPIEIHSLTAVSIIFAQ